MRLGCGRFLISIGGYMDGRMGGWEGAGRSVNGWMNERRDRCVARKTDEEWMDARKKGQVERW